MEQSGVCVDGCLCANARAKKPFYSATIINLFALFFAYRLLSFATAALFLSSTRRSRNFAGGAAIGKNDPHRSAPPPLLRSPEAGIQNIFPGSLTASYPSTRLYVLRRKRYTG